MARLDTHWTIANEIMHWADRSFEKAIDDWASTLPADHEVHVMDDLDRMEAFFASHEDWPMHPDTPTGLLDGIVVSDLRIEAKD